METTEKIATAAPEKPAKQLKPLACPFTILIDSAEQQPWPFTGLRADSDKQYRPLIVTTERRCLGRFPQSFGDYSVCSPIIDGVGRVGIERKSMSDAHSTILGFGDGHRDRFECELENLSKMEAGIVIVECSLSDLIRYAPSRGIRTAQQNAKSLFRSVVAFQQDYGVKWEFCDGPRLAENFAFRWLERWYRKQAEALKADAKSDKLLATL